MYPHQRPASPTQRLQELSDNLNVMVDPIVSKTTAKPITSATEDGGASPLKTSESKFDKVRTRLQDEQAQQLQIPPEVKQISPEQKKVLQADLSKRLEGTKGTSPHEVFGVDMKRAKDKVANLTTRVNSLPKTSAFDPIRSRLTSIDSQFKSTGQLLDSLKSTENPRDLMKIQMQMYQLTENLEMMSKVVEQVTSGTKSILQTQL
jgi:hypothetical protein